MATCLWRERSSEAVHWHADHQAFPAARNTPFNLPKPPALPGNGRHLRLSARPQAPTSTQCRLAPQPA
ncbi:hypothetical protein WJX72_004816 [[Myrmecia] bisecta]|uniref:Uncharacterized protein n=1 Tax=[Myrmecia] bisecta TaxID=41462 RepID=A0AAW1P2A7_9CHLO